MEVTVPSLCPGTRLRLFGGAGREAFALGTYVAKAVVEVLDPCRLKGPKTFHSFLRHSLPPAARPPPGIRD